MLTFVVRDQRLQFNSEVRERYDEIVVLSSEERRDAALSSRLRTYDQMATHYHMGWGRPSLEGARNCA